MKTATRSATLQRVQVSQYGPIRSIDFIEHPKVFLAISHTKGIAVVDPDTLEEMVSVSNPDLSHAARSPVLPGIVRINQGQVYLTRTYRNSMGIPNAGYLTTTLLRLFDAQPEWNDHALSQQAITSLEPVHGQLYLTSKNRIYDVTEGVREIGIGSMVAFDGGFLIAKSGDEVVRITPEDSSQDKPEEYSQIDSPESFRCAGEFLITQRRQLVKQGDEDRPAQFNHLVDLYSYSNIDGFVRAVSMQIPGFTTSGLAFSSFNSLATQFALHENTLYVASQGMLYRADLPDDIHK